MLQFKRHIHITSTIFGFNFMKRQVTVDPELAKLREDRKRRKLEKAILKLKQFSKKTKPVEEIQIDIRLRGTLKDRQRELQQTIEDEQQNRVKLLKEYARSRTRLAIKDLKWIRDSTTHQQKALVLLKQISHQLYDEAIKSDYTILPLLFEGPPLSPPIPEYKSPDGDYINVTKQWVQPILPLLSKRFGVGRLIKTPSFKKNAEQQHKGANKEVMEKKLTAIQDS